MTTKKPAAASKPAAPKKAKATPKPTAKKPAKAAPKPTAKKQAKAAPKPAAKKAAAAPKPAATKAAAAPKPAAKQAAAAPKPAAPKQAKATPKPAAKQAAAAPKSAAPKKAAAVDYDAVLTRIEAKAAAAGVQLAKGASAREIAATEKVLGAKLPDDVVAFYRRHDGSDDEPAVEGRELLSLARIVSEWKIWKDLLDQGTFEENDHGMPSKGVQKKWWIPEWVPVTYDGAGNHHVIDLAPAKEGVRGQVLSFWHDDDSRRVVAKSFLEWLDSAAWGDGEGETDAGSDDGDGDGDGDFARYEMDKKFWSIRLEGASFTVRFGKLGTDGQEQSKSFDDAAAAKKEHDKLVAAKVKKGYREV